MDTANAVATTNDVLRALEALAPQWADRTVAELFEAAFAGRWSNTKNEPWLRWAYAQRIAPTFGVLRLREVTADLVEAFSLTLRDRPYLHNRVMAALRTVWNLARRWRWVPRESDPFEGVQHHPEAPRTRSLSVAERSAWESARAELEVEASKATTRRACRAFRLALLSAMRPSESYGLRRDAVDRARRGVVLVDHKTARSVGVRFVPLCRKALELLDATEPVGDSPYYFPGRVAGQPLRNPSDAFHLICKRAGLVGVQPRDLRRTWGTEAINRGENLKAISLQLGHTTVRTTERHYAHLNFANQSAVADRIGEAL